MHADLVGAAGLDADLAVRMPSATLQHAEVADRFLADRVDLHMALAALAQAHVQRRIDRHHAVGHAPGQQAAPAARSAPSASWPRSAGPMCRDPTGGPAPGSAPGAAHAGSRWRRN
ncbi:hypothetical protein G6F23_014908 [Rhizopus arrhizus]|nr:hypothetical protein G6F23_014908 [Rhizopus arrhizus]